jgi:hypothetical protein
MTRGLSFPHGVMFFSSHYISCAWNKGDRSGKWVRRRTFLNLCYAAWWFASSFSYKEYTVFTGGLLTIFISRTADFPAVPFYTFIWLLFSFHFWFPQSMRQYHAAEHKVFSYKASKINRMNKSVNGASAVNRSCSTNVVVLYFLLLFLLFLVLMPFFSFGESLTISSYSAAAGSLFLQKWLSKQPSSKLREFILKASFLVQEKITTAPPGPLHQITALRAYYGLFAHRPV